MVKPNIALVSSAELFFYELFTECTDKKKIVSDGTAHYVTTLLANRLINLGYMGENFGETLVDLLRESLKDEDRRKALTQDLGETVLVAAGIFPDNLLHRRVSKNYYIDMGSRAYETLSDMTLPPNSEMYNELAHQFRDVIRVLNTIADTTMFHRDKAIARTYELWLQTRSDQFAKRLLRNGIPVQIRKEKIIS